MKEPEENEIYDLFRGLNSPGKNAFSDDSWDKMEQLLNKQPGRKSAVIWFHRVSTGIAAALLLFAMVYFLKPATPAPNRLTKSSGGHLLKPVVNGARNIPKEQPGLSTDPQIKKEHPVLFTSVAKQLPGEHKNSAISPQVKLATKDSPLVDSVSQAGINLAAIGSRKVFADSIGSLSAEISATDLATGIYSATRTQKIKKTVYGASHQLALSVLAAPDINNVNKIGNGQLGSNFGLQFSMQLSKRISLSSGAFYAVKPYQTAAANYKPQTPNWWANKFGSTGTPDQVTANCKVLDIPLNVNYLVFNKDGNKFSVGSGLSSYFMLSESYNFSFANPSVNTTNFEINNRNQHLFGLVNLNATYERKVNNRFGIVIQPYLKLPITQIGFGQVDLRSTGVSAGLSWNINSSKTK